MNLESLNPKYVRYELKPYGIVIDGCVTEHGTPFSMSASGHKELIHTANTIDESNGITFDCPYCAEPHRVTCWNTSVPIFASPSRYRWKISGDSFANLNVEIMEKNEFVIDRPNHCVWSKPIINGVIS